MRKRCGGVWSIQASCGPRATQGEITPNFARRSDRAGQSPGRVDGARPARVVDVGTGSGDAAGRAVERGAITTGVDVAAAMVEIAARRHPAVRFVQASATRLPFAEGSFEAAVGNIVIQHIGEPERAAHELARVLVSGGRVALSTWDAPERSPFFAMILGAVADADVPSPTGIPAGPSFFQFADDIVFAA